jgi:Leu/Phe-tRNA-protein transferase
LDAFEAFVDEQLANLNEYRQTRFPVAYREDGPTWDRVDHRDLILTDR